MLEESEKIHIKEATKALIKSAKSMPSIYDMNDKLDIIVNEWNALNNYTKIELIEKFTEAEINLILNSTNGMIFSVDISPILSLHNNIAYDIDTNESDICCGVNKTTILDKILGLTAHQAYIIIQLSKEFWNSEDPNSINVKSMFMTKN